MKMIPKAFSLRQGNGPRTAGRSIRLLVFFCCGMLLILGLSGCSNDSSPSEPPPPPEGDPSVAYTSSNPNPGSNTVTLQQSLNNGPRLELDVTLTDVTSVSSMAFDLVFNPGIFNYVGFTQGAFFEAGGTDVSYQVAENPEGRLIVGIARLGDQDGVTGDGVAITITLNAVSNGGSNFSYETAQLVDPALNAIEGVQWFGGSANVTGF